MSRSNLKLSKIQEIWPIIPASLYLLGFLIIVLVYLLGLSFSHTASGTFPTVKTYSAVFQMEEFRESLLNTFLFVVVGTPLELIVGLFLALLLYKTFFLRDFIRSFMLIPLAIPALVTAIILYILFDYPGGHINHLLLGKYAAFPQLIQSPVNWRGAKVFALGVSLMGKVWRDMPISMLIILAGLNSIDPELFDAARTMGAGFRQQLRRVVLPLILPSMSAVVLLRSIEMWKEFIFPFVLGGQQNLLGTLIESLYNNWGYTDKAAVVALVLVACIILTSLVLILLAELNKRILRR
ncbi:MAG: ABC transporter permease subunit [Chitinivibrionales bacterium]|nr:ABC transporter permease subunit [Chitinivibrionales bacterium]